MIDTPSVDWLALSPTLALLGASGVALLGAVLVPSWMRRTLAAIVAFAGFVVAAVFAGILFDATPQPEALLQESMIRDQLGALAQLILAITGAVVVFVSWAERRRDNHGEYYAASSGSRSACTSWSRSTASAPRRSRRASST
jgi:NADH-quinone oxidoreductase subunit N